MKKITELTQEQKDAIPGWTEKWIQKGLKTGEADWATFERGIRAAYKFAELDGDNLEIIHVQSPIVALTEGPKKAAKLEGIPEKDYDEYVKKHWHNYIGGQGWISWAAYTNYWKDVCDLELEGDLWDRNAAYTDILTSVWLCWPHEKFVMACNRPSEINLDEEGRLHAEDRKAIFWPDNWGLYCWHGVTVPEKVILDPNSYTIDEIKEINNTEVVRALAEKLGWENYLKKLGAEVIDTWIDENTGLKYELLESKMRFGEMEPRLLKKQSSVLQDGTQPWYIEPVHFGLKSAQAARKFQAMAAFADADENTYEQLMQHCNDNPKLDYSWER